MVVASAPGVKAVSAGGAAESGAWLGPARLLLYLSPALAAAALTELLLFRMLSRAGVYLPKEGLVLDAYRTLTGLGSFAFNLAGVLSLLVLATAVALGLGRRQPSMIGAAVTLGLGYLLLASLLAPLAGSAPLVTLVNGLGFLAVLLLLALSYWRAEDVSPGRKAVVGLMVAAYAASQHYSLSQTGAQLSGGSMAAPMAVPALAVGEALAVVNGLAIFVLWGLSTRGDAARRAGLGLIGAALAVLLMGWLIPGEAAAGMAILSLWTAGLTLYLPAPLYALSLAAFALAAANCLRRQDRLLEGCGLLLILAGGYMVETTYHQVLAVVGLLLLTQARDLLATDRAARLVALTQVTSH